MMKLTALAAVVAVALSAAGSSLVAARRGPDGRTLTRKGVYTYDMYVRDFKRTGRTPAEHEMRRALFDAEMDKIVAHNSKKLSWWVGVNDFSDWTAEEKKTRLTNPSLRGLKKHTPARVKPQRVHKVDASGNPPPFQVDWRKVTPPVLSDIKDQGMCGSCWAHASTETMESRWAIATGKLSVLSQEQVTQCTPNPNQCGGTGGCGGATHELAYDYATQAGGLTEEWIYPYTSYFGTTGTCQAVNDVYFKRATFNGYVKVATNDAASLMHAVSEGPVAITVAAVPFLNYEGGVFKGCGLNNASIDLDHGVQLVGYGYDNDSGNNYWIVRNSWSPSWGQSGYIYMYRAPTPAQESCGWDNTPQDGVACKGDNQPEWTCGECGLLYDTSYPIAAP